MPGRRDFQTLIVGLATQIIGGHLDIQKYLVSFAWIKGIVAPIMLYIGDNSADGSIGGPNARHHTRTLAGIQDLVAVTQGKIGRVILEIAMPAKATAVFQSREIN